MNEFCLSNIDLDTKAIIKKINADDSIKRRLFDLGLTPGTIVQKKLKNFSGNMYAYMVRGALIAIRNDDANEILVEVI